MAAVISVLERFSCRKKMGGDGRPDSGRISTFSGDQEEVEILIAEQRYSRAKHLEFKADGRSEPGVREGMRAASLIYMKIHGNPSR